MKTIIVIETRDDFNFELINKLYNFLEKNNIQAEISRDFANDSTKVVTSFFSYD